ncbi:MAG: phosphoadenylyl-sulfate reductase [Rubrivivax sp.]
MKPATDTPSARSAAIELYARPSDGYEQRLAQTLAWLSEAAQAHPQRIVQSTSLGAEDMVLTDLIAHHRLPIAIATLDTGMLHQETHALMSRIERRYALPIERHAPQRDTVLHFVRQHGEQAMVRSIDLRKACCGMRKLEPLSRLLAGRTAWVTGLRREQSAQRGSLDVRQADEAGRIKLNPLAEWSWHDVWHYIDDHDVPYNDLHDQFFPSIGCVPCTRAIAVGEDFRAGRWWWENEDAKECGLHVGAHVDKTGVTA